MPNHTVQKGIYNGFVVPAAYGLLSAAALFHGKLKETFATRKDIRERWRASGVRFEQKPVWFHVASVGEYEQAKPVISRLAERHPGVPIALTFTSPSGYNYASKKERVGGKNNIKFMEYLPLDFADNARFCLAFLNPRLLVFVKFDIWPNLVWESARNQVPCALIDATLSSSSYRISSLGKRFYRAVYSDLDRIMAISDRDAERFVDCVPTHDGISVTGDTRFDRVMERKQITSTPSTEIDTQGKRVIIAGSTWPKDETHLLPALARLAGEHDNLLLIIAPHEPSADRVDELIRWAEGVGRTAGRLSEYNAETMKASTVLIVDSVGVLAETYRFADVAYIGGSFSTGVHSVIEPAIMGVPVIFGPNHKNSFEALELLRHEAAYEVDSVDAIYDRLSALVKDDSSRMKMGDRAKGYVESQLGATDRCMATLAGYF